MFIVGRAVAGLGVSGMVNGALSIVTTSVEKEKSPLYVGILMGTAQMGESYREVYKWWFADCIARDCRGSADWRCPHGACVVEMV
jgi:MFS family permease